MSTPRHIYVIRHCEREDDVNRVWYFNSHFTRDNPPLSERGLIQANDLKREYVFIFLKLVDTYWGHFGGYAWVI